MLFLLFIVVQCLSLLPVEGKFCLFKRSPEQLRLAFRESNSITVSWRTGGNFGSNDTPNPQVEYSTDINFGTKTLSPIGATTSYVAGSFFHNVALPNLLPSTKYYYRILATTECVRESDKHSFTSAPTVGNPGPVSIGIIGDLGNDNLVNGGASTRTMNLLRQTGANTDFFIHAGDIVYADDYGLLLPFEFYEEAYNKWQGNMEAVTADKVYMTAAGNHEVTCFQLGDAFCLTNTHRNFSAYLNRFRMPGDESGGYKNLWYSYDYGSAHIVVINTETDFPDAPAGPGTTLNGGNFQGLTGQLAWFENDLIKAVANRAQVPWIIVIGHRPFYSSLPKLPALPGNCDACRTVFEPLILQYNVDFYFSGHVHWYERLYPIDANGNPLATNYNNQPGPIHVVNGAGGCPEGAAQLKTAGPASAKIVTGYGFSRLELQDASNARLSFISSDTSQEVDSVNIIRNH